MIKNIALIGVLCLTLVFSIIYFHSVNLYAYTVDIAQENANNQNEIEIIQDVKLLDSAMQQGDIANIDIINTQGFSTSGASIQNVSQVENSIEQFLQSYEYYRNARDFRNINRTLDFYLADDFIFTEHIILTLPSSEEQLNNSPENEATTIQQEESLKMDRTEYMQYLTDILEGPKRYVFRISDYKIKSENKVYSTLSFSTDEEILYNLRGADEKTLKVFVRTNCNAIVQDNFSPQIKAMSCVESINVK